MTKTTTTTEDMAGIDRAEVRRVLENEFWPFLAHDPHDPELFWGQAVDAVMRAAARAETTTAPEPAPEPVWPTAPYVWHDGKVWQLDSAGRYNGPHDTLHEGHLDFSADVIRNDASRFAREAEPVRLITEKAWETWRRSCDPLDMAQEDRALIEAVDSLAQEVAR